jgi:hypothetical protein
MLEKMTAARPIQVASSRKSTWEVGSGNHVIAHPVNNTTFKSTTTVA